jgi:hypothetical protein
MKLSFKVCLIVIALLSVVVISIAVEDCWLWTQHGQSATISAQILKASRMYPMIPFMTGLSVGILYLCYTHRSQGNMDRPLDRDTSRSRSGIHGWIRRLDGLHNRCVCRLGNVLFRLRVLC